MDVNIIKVGKLMAEECKKCIEKGLCFRCQEPGHLSPNFKKNSPKVHQVTENLPKLEAIEDDEEEENIRRVTFSMVDFWIRKLL